MNVKHVPLVIFLLIVGVAGAIQVADALFGSWVVVWNRLVAVWIALLFGRGLGRLYENGKEAGAKKNPRKLG